MEYFHRPVLLEESIAYLVQNKEGIYVDCTLGGAGHTAHILEKIYPEGFVIGFDKDRDAIYTSIKRLKRFDPSFLLIKGDFRETDVWLKKIGVDKVNGVIADLGISSYQVDNKDRGFSFSSKVLPDMRMDKTKGKSAWDVLNESSVSLLSEIFSTYGEIKRSYEVASFIKRNLRKIKSAEELSELLKKRFPKRGRIHPATLVFQALRIYVNDELGALKDLLFSLPHILNSGGRVVIISYHSLEDRMIKNFFKSSQELKVITKKPITPTYKEIRENRRARSAKMRVAERMRRE